MVKTTFNTIIWLLKNLTSLHTSMVPNTTCRPSKKLSPMMMTVAPPVVHPSLGLMALMHGVAAYPRQREEQIQHLKFQRRGACPLSIKTHSRTTSVFHPPKTFPSTHTLTHKSPTKTYQGNCPLRGEEKWWICPLRHENQNHLSVRWSGVVKQTLQMVHFTKAKRRGSPGKWFDGANYVPVANVAIRID